MFKKRVLYIGRLCKPASSVQVTGRHILDPKIFFLGGYLHLNVNPITCLDTCLNLFIISSFNYLIMIPLESAHQKREERKTRLVGRVLAKKLSISQSMNLMLEFF
jgi:hypothetical protein